MAPVVHLRGAVSLLGRFPALAGADLDVDAGEVVLLRGPNGAGKTTLLRLCAGLLPVSGGTAEVLGVDLVADRRGVRHRVGLVGHGAGLYEDLTVAENVAFWGRATGAGEDDVAGALARLGLDGRLRDLPVARLSAGQKRRASIAAMVARRPELWLLDEPHASLDADGRDLVDALVRDSVAAGATVLLASHEDDRATAIATRVVEVRGGTTLPVGEPPVGEVSVGEVSVGDVSVGEATGAG
mgnify:CR=1 FL=1